MVGLPPELDVSGVNDGTEKNNIKYKKFIQVKYIFM